MSSLKKNIFNIYTVNHAGVLMRISQAFSRRGYNIESLAVSTAQNSDFSHITISAYGDEQRLDQIVKQVHKLVDVISCYVPEEDNSIVLDFMMLKLELSANECLKNLGSIIAKYDIEKHSISDEVVILQKTTTLENIDSIISELEEFYNIIEIRRSGPILMEKTIMRY